ncbi:hypothetical protein ACS0TY_036452 [Phlomoides rotata]
MRQGETESLRAFLKRLNQAALEVPTASPEKPVATFDDLLRMAEKYITLEEVRKAKKAELKPLASEKKKAHESPRGQKRKDLEKKQDDKGKAPLVHNEDREQSPQKRGMIQMIMGGPTDGDSFRQRKLNVRNLKAE